MSQTTATTTTRTHWLHPDLAVENSHAWETVDSLCIGTGRFLRAVLVPILTRNGTVNSTVLVQPRGRSFVDYFVNHQNPTLSSYEIDTVLRDGSLESTEIPVAGAFTWNDEATTAAFYDLCLPRLTNVRVLGIGVTEAGLASHDTPVMKALYMCLDRIKHLRNDHPAWRRQDSRDHTKICVINMDNVPQNGSTLQRHMKALAAEANDNSMALFLDLQIVFVNTMVDRITSQREGSNGLVPRAEPIPQKALVVLDLHQDLPDWMRALQNNQTLKKDGSMARDENTPESLGLVIRKKSTELRADLALKLRIANGTHTALAHTMALLQCPLTDLLSQEKESPLATALLQYIQALVKDQILPATTDIATKSDANLAWQDWFQRLTHAHFGLSTFFITQNGAAKGGIRLGPTVTDLIQSSDPEKSPLTVAMAYAFAALLRWLTPDSPTLPPAEGQMYRGWLPFPTPDGTGTVSYADGLRHNFREGWYEFRCVCNVRDLKNNTTRNLADWLSSLRHSAYQPSAYVPVVRAYLESPDGGNQSGVAATTAFGELCQAVATLYARMVVGDDLHSILTEIMEAKGLYNQGWSTPCTALVDQQQLSGGAPLYFRPHPIPSNSNLMQATVCIDDMAAVVVSEVAGVPVVDLHTHLLPPSHGPLCLWGIDELLTYHYLVSEYFMTAPPEMTPEGFYAMTKQEQASLIWKSLFLDRSPVSEACRGVLTTLLSLGFRDEVRTRNLTAIRAFYASYRNRGEEGAAAFSDLVFAKAGVRYNIMTNIPFDSNEARFWRPRPASYSRHYRSALRVDPLLAGDKEVIEAALRGGGYEVSLEGARQYLRDWCETMKPEYMMASTPHDFVLDRADVTHIPAVGSVNMEAIKQPGAFAQSVAAETCSPVADSLPTVIDENSDFLTHVLMAVCEELDLPLALKIGAHRGLNPSLRAAGDGMVAFADASALARLCTRFPKVRFLATFLSRNNQHEACVLASKFRNLHIYGAWWYCNNPCIIEDITKMRIQMLGTACTLQHSDARVLDQLLYKWSHSRSVIASVLKEEYVKLAASGWSPTRSEIRRDIERLLGASYEEFMKKSLGQRTETD